MKMYSLLTFGCFLLSILILGTDADPTECGGRPCIHGTCSGSTCTCDSGYIGPMCGTSYDDCSPNPCLNGARCVDLHQSYMCVCAEGFEGQTCNIHSACKRAHCQQGGNCVQDGSDYYCTCPSGYTGKNCESIVDSWTVDHILGLSTSSSYSNGEPEYAVDGYTYPYHNATHYCSHTHSEPNPFWAVIFDDVYPIRQIRVHNNILDGKGYRFDNIELFIDGSLQATWDESSSVMLYREIIDFYFPEGTTGRSVNITKVNDDKLALCEVQVWGYVYEQT